MQKPQDTNEQRAQEKSLARLKDYKSLFTSPAGQRVLKDMMQKFGMMRTTAAMSDPYTTYFFEGQRAVILFLLDKTKTDIAKLEKMIQEQGESDE